MEPGPQNAVVGDVTDLPSTEMPEAVLNEEKNLARFSKSKEFQKLKEYIENRINSWKLHQPNGEPIVLKDVSQERINDWYIANHVIGELQAIIDVYQNAENVVKEHESRRNSTL